MSRKQRLQLRNEKVRTLFNQYCHKHPQWRVDAIINDISNLMYLSPRTIEGIVRGEGIYNTNAPTTPNQQKLHFE